MQLLHMEPGHYLAPGRSDLSLRVSVCPLTYLDNHMAELRQIFKPVAGGRGLILLWQKVAMHYVLPVLWMTSRFHVVCPVVRREQALFPSGEKPKQLQ